MGNHLSPVLCNLYLEFANIIYDIHHGVFFWRRCVDNIFCLWPRGRNIDKFMLVNNNLVHSTVFTFERESVSSVSRRAGSLTEEKLFVKYISKAN